MTSAIFHNNLDGMTIDQLSAQIGRNRSATINWLTGKGFRVVDDGSLRPIKSAVEVQDEILRRPTTLTSCFLCGARSCAHQGAE